MRLSFPVDIPVFKTTTNNRLCKRCNTTVLVKRSFVAMVRQFFGTLVDRHLSKRTARGDSFSPDGFQTRVSPKPWYVRRWAPPRGGAARGSMLRWQW